VDAGDSWFHANRLRLPGGAAHEIQMQYASIGWSVGATLGYALARPDRRVMTILGDGAFQMTAQVILFLHVYFPRRARAAVRSGRAAADGDARACSPALSCAVPCRALLCRS
jgi:hypothetical protein